MSIPINELPPPAAAAAEQLRTALVEILGDDLIAMWVHGGTTFSDRPAKRGDLDVCSVVKAVSPNERDPSLWRDNPATRPHAIRAAEVALAADYAAGVDSIYVLGGDLDQEDPPSEAFRHQRRLVMWPVYRAHWLAGQYVHLLGFRPEELVEPPTQAELRHALDRELEHLERHVYEGDAADPYEATYAIWNGCRILYTLSTGSPVISKRSAGAWALTNLDEDWHPAIRAAWRTYDGEPAIEDRALLQTVMPQFVAMVRHQLPITEARPVGPPRWS